MIKNLKSPVLCLPPPPLFSSRCEMNSYPSTGLTIWYSHNTFFFINSWVKWQDARISFPRKELQHNNNTICLPTTYDNTIYRHVEISSDPYSPHTQIHFFFSTLIYSQIWRLGLIIFTLNLIIYMKVWSCIA